MRLQELAEVLQKPLEDGKLNIIIYQQGRQWKYESFSSDTEEENEAGKMQFLKIKHQLDDEAIIINGKKDFENYDLKYIEKRIKSLKG
ncbi:hypothetical protein [Alkaliphilus serpentinus]|uniref:Large polyvalent-protein-associated domain-containing protein n=1 Tax=Alkaliphilus serpentinus TaxID=1482731 RepID=A0A833M8T7_9FIRM|nr:hypothetical protein [Alkaliphilus serpentinus]KAB3531576.1 hypothetical protein F8153_05220 [Alkaliphilus serpentinus]